MNPNEEHLLEQRISNLEAQVADLQRQVEQLSALHEEHLTPIEQETDQFANPQTSENIVEPCPEEAEVAFDEAEIAMDAEPINPFIRVQEASSPTVKEEDVIVLRETSAKGPASETTESASAEEPTKKVNWEERIGKKLIPIAGSALIIFALILFGSLIQPRLSDTMKAIIMAVVSLSITGFGVWKMKETSKYYTFFSALTGCGAAACYTSSLVAHFALHVLPELGLMACIVVWIAAMTALSKYKSRMFCYICYVGILIAAYMTVQRWCNSPIGLIAYIVSISALYATNYTKEYKPVAWMFVQYPLVMFPMADTYSDSLTALVLIYGSTLAILVAQLWHYKAEVKDNIPFTIATLLSVAVFFCCGVGLESSEDHSAGRFLFDNAWGWGWTIALTMAGLTYLLLRLYGQSDRLYKKMLCLTIVLIPMLNYGSYYQDWCGRMLVPSLILLTIGCIKAQKGLRYVGYAYLFFFTWDYAPKMLIKGELNLQVGVFVYIAILAGCWYWWNRQRLTLDKKILLLITAWGFIQLCVGYWIDRELTYLLLCALALAMQSKLLLPTADEQTQEVSTTAHRWIICAGCASLIGRLANAWFDSMDDSLLSLPNAYGNPFIGCCGAMLVWGTGVWKQRESLKQFGYLLFAINLWTNSPWDQHSTLWFTLAIFIGSYAYMIYHTIKHYSMTDKLFLTGMLFIFLLLPLWEHKYHEMEFWLLSSAVIVICNLSRFRYDPTTGHKEPLTHTLCILANDVCMFLGTLLLRYNHEQLYWGREFDNTADLATVLLVVMTLFLAGITLKRIYALSGKIAVNALNIYNGLKLTWVLYIVLVRFSAVSYVISIAGIVLAIIIIAAGFRYHQKNLRQYGLALTMLCVIKLLFFDILFDNAFYRPVSFLIAGLLLFLISFIYIRLEKRTKEE